MRTFRLDEIARLRYGKLPPKNKLDEPGFPIYTGYRISGFAEDFLYEDEQVVVVARGVGGTGNVRLSPKQSWITNLCIVLEVDASTIDRRFLVELLDSQDLKRKLDSGSAQSQITIQALAPYQVRLPPLPVQRSITQILSAYDDLIENNNRRMALLEESIHLLYREWFVYLRFPGQERVKVVDDVPDGWRKELVGDLLQPLPTRKKIPKKDYQPTGAIPAVDQGADLVGGYTDDSEALYSSELLPLVVFGDHTRILKFVDFPFARGADGTQVLAPVDGTVSPHFLYFSLSQIDLSAFGYARHFKYLKAELCPVPTVGEVRAFDEVAVPAMRLVSTLRSHNRLLRQARDLLLPRLMDGRIPV